MQKSKTFKRLLAAVLSAALMLAAIPFSATAETTKDTIVFGSYVWDVLKAEADGDLILITKDIVTKVPFYSTTPTASNPISYATGSINSYLNDGESSFYATAFNADEKAAIAPSTLSYIYYDATANAKTTGTLEAYVIIPNEAMATEYELGIANFEGKATQYWLADATAASATLKQVRVITVGGKPGNLTVATNKIAHGLRPMITLKAGNYAQFPAVDGVSFTINDNAATYYATTSDVAFKVVVDTENYEADNMQVTLGGEALTAADGVYTIPAGSTAPVAVTGLTAQPADFTAYNEALAQAGEVDRELCETADLDAALAIDVSACTKFEQAKVDAATAAILDAIANLKYKPADTAAYLEAVKETRRILANEPVQITDTLTASIYNLDATANEIGDDFRNAMNDALIAYEDGRDITPISTYTIDKQAEVDAATAVLEDLNARVPFMRADTSAWSATLGNIRNLSPLRYANAGKLIAEANAIAAETDYAALNPDILQQADVDAATAKLKEIYAKAEIIPADFSSLDAVLAIANTYVKENYYTEEEMAGAGDAWNNFEKARDAAKALNREDNAIFADHQKNIDSAVSTLINAMEKLPAFERLTDEEVKYINPTKDFFTEIMNFFGMISGLLVAIAGILPLLFFPPEEGGLVLYDVFALIGDEDLLAFVEKLGIKPAPEEPAPEEPAE